MMHVSFREVEKVLEQAGSTVPAAESHGCLCGAACNSANYPLERWLEEIMPEESAAYLGSGDQAMQLLFSDTLRALREDQMEFEPLLPDDDVGLAQRAQALALWCQGFLYGFGTGDAAGAGELPANVSEVLRDLGRIGRVAAEIGEVTEEEEQAYAEIIEYLRAGVQLVHDELVQARAANAARHEAH